MKIKALVTSFVLFIVSNCFSQDLPALIPFRDGKKWGYVNKDKITIIPFRFDSATPFTYYSGSGNIANVTIGKKDFWIDESGKEVENSEIDQFDFIKLDESEGVYKEDKFFGLKDKNGKVILPAIYDSISPINRQQHILLVKKNNKYGYVNEEGKFITEIKYEMAEIYDINYPLYLVKYQGKTGYIDINGVEYFKN